MSHGAKRAAKLLRALLLAQATGALAHQQKELAAAEGRSFFLSQSVCVCLSVAVDLSSNGEFFKRDKRPGDEIDHVA